MNKLTNPFDADIHKTERTANQKLVEWLNQVIKEKNLSFGFAEQETAGSDRKQPDVIIYKQPQSKEITLVMELKPPFFNPLDFEQMKKPAWEKAVHRHAPYFATCNFKNIFLFNTQKTNEQLPELQQIVNKYPLSSLEDLNSIDDPVFTNQFLKNLGIFLSDLKEFVSKQKTEKPLAVDEWVILLLHQHIETLALLYQSNVRDRCLNDAIFRDQVKKWLNNQGRDFILEDESVYRHVARQTAYFLVNKILFYDVLRSSMPQKFPQIKIPEDYQSGGMVRGFVQNYFNQVLNIDYETIFETDFIDEIAFPENRGVVDEVRKLTDNLNRFDWSQIPYDTIGRIFEDLAPTEERRDLGQYFTNPDIVDLILGFALRDSRDIILDPACGAGTFLRRAYDFQMLNDPSLTHEQILPCLWGTDIDKMAAGLSTINLSVANIRSLQNYPRIVWEDFFKWQPGNIDKLLKPQRRELYLKGINNEEAKTILPQFFDAIVGNPPYTRQEDVDKSRYTKNDDYKDNLIDTALLDVAGKPYAKISRRAGLYAYFFIHGTKFLKDGGRFGFVVSNSWLDVDYGAGLQEHFLRHYQIKAIVESRVERWFEQASVNTCLVLLEKCEGNDPAQKQKREENLVKFVSLKKPLVSFLPPASEIQINRNERKNAVGRFWQDLLAQNISMENDFWSIVIKKQNDLWNEGWNEEKNDYLGAKWGKYLRAPKIYFTILEKCRDKFVPLKEVAEVKRGITSGANKFFYLTEEEIKRKGIEKEFWMHQNENGEWIPNYVVKSPQECQSIYVDQINLKYRIILTDKDRVQLRNKNILAYIKEGEIRELNRNPSCNSRKKWWKLNIDKTLPDLLWPDAYNDRYGAYLSSECFADKRFFTINLKNKNDLLLLAAFLNSSLIPLLIEINGITNLGEGAIYTNVYWLKELLVPPSMPHLENKIKSALKKLSERKIESIFKEICTTHDNEISLEKILPDRRELDKIIMGEILGLTEEEQLEVYRALIELVKNRLDRAKSVKKTTNRKSGIDITKLVNSIYERVGSPKLGNFYKTKILAQKEKQQIVLPNFVNPSQIKKSLMGFSLTDDRQSVDFNSEEEAKFCQIFYEAGWTEFEIPRNIEIIKKLLPVLEKIAAEIKENLNYYLDGALDAKIHHQVTRLVWQKVSQYE